MTLAVWLIFGFSLGVLFTASALSYFARSFIHAFDEDLERTAARLTAQREAD